MTPESFKGTAETLNHHSLFVKGDPRTFHPRLLSLSGPRPAGAQAQAGAGRAHGAVEVGSWQQAGAVQAWSPAGQRQGSRAQTPRSAELRPEAPFLAELG